MHLRHLAPACLLALPLLAPADLPAALYRLVDAQSASVDSTTWSLADNGVTYSAVRKGTTDIPWISPSQAYTGANSVGFRAYGTSGTGTDKITYPLVLGSAAFAPAANGGSGYTGFALKLPSATDFQTPSAKLLLVQWWQGAPYGPPLRLAITGGDANGVTYRLLVFNNNTLGNPSSVPIDIGGGTISYGAWHTFVVYTKFNYAANGEVTVWQNGSQVLAWNGAPLGYDPATIPYYNPPDGTASPNPKLQIEFGLYREVQAKKHMYFIDQVKFADTYSEALP